MNSLTENREIDLDGASVLVTGGTGSFGKHFVRRLLSRHDPARVVVFSRDEFKQYEMENSFGAEERDKLRFFIGDVRDRDRLIMAMRGIDTVIHAAALKHVPTAEYNPFECVHTNIIGAENVVNAAIQTEVQRVIALSTDKAASPVNLYGATKLASDKIFVAANNLVGTGGTRFAVVRYGNVVGSRGSVIPLFEKLIAEGAENLPITDERMTRFWITLRQGVDFVLGCLGRMRGGEIFVPKIPSMRMIDLAHCMAPGLPHRIIGVRPGEKIHEILVTRDDARNTIELDDCYVIEPSLAFWNREPYLDDGAKPVGEEFQYSSDLNDRRLDEEGLRRLLKEAAAE